MDSKTIELLYSRIYHRLESLNNSSWQMYDSQLKQFWHFLMQNPVTSQILTSLSQNKSNLDKELRSLIDGSLTRGDLLTFNTETDHVSASYQIIQACVNSKPSSIRNQIAISIGQRYTTDTSFQSHIEAFHNTFLVPLSIYILESLDEQQYLSYLLKKYKHRSEWFLKDTLLTLWSNNRNKGEKLLAKDLYSFLYDQGLDFHIEPQSANGEIDFISEQIGDERLLIEIKIFNDDKRNILEGFNQLFTYLATYNQGSGFLAVFNVGSQELCFSTRQANTFFHTVYVNNKYLHLFVIDLRETPTASKKGVLKPIVISESELVQTV